MLTYQQQEMLPGRSAFPGGYPVLYIMGDGQVMCWDCLTSEREVVMWPGMDTETMCRGLLPIEALRWMEESELDHAWVLVGWTIHYEGPDEHCANCHARIPSAYG